MKNFFRTLLFAIGIFAVAGAAAAQPDVRRSSRGETDTKRDAAMRGVVNAANRQAFQIGKNFAVAIDDAKYMGTDEEMFNYAIVDLVYLIDSLEGQPEAVQLQTLLKGIVRETKEIAAVSSEISAISKSFFARQTTEKRWYFNVGVAQMNLLLAGWGKDSTGSVTNVKELQTLAKTPPAGTPQIVLDAIKGLAVYAVKPKLEQADFTSLVNDTKIITTLVYA